MRMIASQIKTRARTGAVPDGFRYQIYFVPRRTLICEQVLEDEHILALVQGTPPDLSGLGGLGGLGGTMPKLPPGFQNFMKK